MPGEFEVIGSNRSAKFTLKVHRGDGMALLAMNWKSGRPPRDFVGFAIEYKEPKGSRYWVLNNRLGFRDTSGNLDPRRRSSRFAPIQMFRWVHFPFNAEQPGRFVYRVTPVFMNEKDELRYGEHQEASIELRRDTYPGMLNVTFTRGFVSSQAFVSRYSRGGGISTLLPSAADDPLTFIPTHPQADEALQWMGFEARSAILEVLDEAVADPQAQVRVVAFELNEPALLSRLEKLGDRLRIILDDSAGHSAANSAETRAAARLAATAGANNVKRQHLKQLQHNKIIIVDGPGLKRAVCGSTNFSWRGLYVQSNNAVVLKRKGAVDIFLKVFEAYWSLSPEAFGNSGVAAWNALGLTGIDASVAFSPHSVSNALLGEIADDMGRAKSSLFYSLAFLYQTAGSVMDAVKRAAATNDLFVYGISDKKVEGLDVLRPDGSVLTVYPAALKGSVPKPFAEEPSGGAGVRMHHKFVVIDFDKASARVYLGSYNFSPTADLKNGENLLVIRDRRVATSYAIEALRMIDHYHFRVLEQRARDAHRELALAKPPRTAGESPWWLRYYTDPRRIRDRKLFA